MPRRNAFIAEIAIDLIHAFEATHYQPLQIKLWCDTQIQVKIERVVVRLKRLCRGTTIERLHHGRFHFDEVACFQLAAQG